MVERTLTSALARAGQAVAHIQVEGRLQKVSSSDPCLAEGSPEEQRDLRRPAVVFLPASDAIPNHHGLA